MVERPDKADRTFWTAKAFHGYIRDAYQIECSYETIVRFFRREGFALKIPQPWPDRQDEVLRERFLRKLEELYNNEKIDIWFADESGFEGDPRPRRRWDRKGNKTRVTKNGDHIRMNVTGMICPRTGEFFGVEASHSDSDTFQAFLKEASRFINFQKTCNIWCISIFEVSYSLTVVRGLIPIPSQVPRAPWRPDRSWKTASGGS